MMLLIIIKKKIITYYYTVIIGASILSAVALTKGSAIYNQLRNYDTERHNKAIEKLNNKTTRYKKKRPLKLDYNNYQMHLQQDAISNCNGMMLH